jgi:tRNA dimethylallyltransferase
MGAKKSSAKIPVIAIVGPTASGKSGLAITLAQKLHGEIISADSRQVYVGLDIGTGKVTKREMRGIPHHLLDITSPKKHLSVEEWQKYAQKAIADIHRRGKIVIVCGGTGLYVDALLRGLSIPEVAPNPKLRKMLEKKSPSALFMILKTIDPRRAREIDRNNPRRLVRAIEIARALGKVPKRIVMPTPYRTLWIGINPTDVVLKKNIRVRLLARMKAGMTREAKKLHAQGLSYKRMREFGLEYRFLADYLEEKTSKEKMLAELEKAIWQYAKRQRTWWKRHKDINWLKQPTATAAMGRAKVFLRKGT